MDILLNSFWAVGANSLIWKVRFLTWDSNSTLFRRKNPRENYFDEYWCNNREKTMCLKNPVRHFWSDHTSNWTHLKPICSDPFNQIFFIKKEHLRNLWSVLRFAGKAAGGVCCWKVLPYWTVEYKYKGTKNKYNYEDINTIFNFTMFSVLIACFER